MSVFIAKNREKWLSSENAKKKKSFKKKSLAALQSDPNYNTARLALKDVWRSKRSC